MSDDVFTDMLEDDHPDCKNGCRYAYDVGGAHNRVCPHGECQRNSPRGGSGVCVYLTRDDTVHCDEYVRRADYDALFDKLNQWQISAGAFETAWENVKRDRDELRELAKELADALVFVVSADDDAMEEFKRMGIELEENQSTNAARNALSKAREAGII